MLRDSVVVAVVRTCPRAIPLVKHDDAKDRDENAARKGRICKTSDQRKIDRIASSISALHHCLLIPLAMIAMRKSTHGFPFVSHMSMGLRLAALRASGAPLLPQVG